MYFHDLKTLGFFGLKAVVFILCLKLHTRSVLFVFFVAMHARFLPSCFFYFYTTGYSFERSCRRSQQESSQNSSWPMKSLLLHVKQILCSKMPNQNFVYKTSLLRDTTHEQTLYKRLLSTTCSIIWFMSLNSFTITWIDERYLKFLQISPNMFHRCDTVKSTFSWSVSNETF